MKWEVTRRDVEKMVEDLRSLVPKEACWSCDCVQGFLAQLEMDAVEDVSDLLGDLR
jgi:hypothetical protein